MATLRNMARRKRYRVLAVVVALAALAALLSLDFA